jgi:arylsulfatase A-like enzyme
LATLLQREHEGDRTMVVEDGWKFVHDPMGDLDELYDLTSDPNELTNRSQDPEQASRVARLRQAILDWRRA